MGYSSKWKTWKATVDIFDDVHKSTPNVTFELIS